MTNQDLLAEIVRLRRLVGDDENIPVRLAAKLWAVLEREHGPAIRGGCHEEAVVQAMGLLSDVWTHAGAEVTVLNPKTEATK